MKNSPELNSLIDCASNLFYNNGYMGTTIDQIIEKANVSRATFDNYFESKQHICVAHLRYRNEEFIKAVNVYVNQAPKGKAKIMALFQYMELFFQMEDFNGCWNIKAFSEIPKDETLVREEILAQKNGLIAFVEQLIQENFLPVNEKDLKQLVQQIYLVLESAVIESNLHGKEWPITRAKELCSQILDLRTVQV
ncbi:TetR/AcrR family transcriptional regulator [Flagellimonas sp. 2504JD1-5]